MLTSARLISKRLIKSVALTVLALAFIFASCVVAAVVGGWRRWKRTRGSAERNAHSIVWGSAPIKNNCYWSRAVRTLGFTSETFTTEYYATINDRSDWDRLLDEAYHFLPALVRPYAGFLDGLIRYDIFVVPFSGFFLGEEPVWRLQAPLIKLAGGRIIAIPYGSDAYSYRHIRSTALTHGLMMSYPSASQLQRRVEARLKYWSDHADVVIPGFMGPDGFGRWDVLIPSSVFIELSDWRQSRRLSMADGKTESVFIAHAPNHRGFKGSEFLIAAVDKLKAEGLKVELVLLERVKNSEVQRIFETMVDIHVEQLVAPGFGMNAIEGMASGLPVIANLENEDYIGPFRRWSYFSECPVVSATPESIAKILRSLITEPQLRHELGDANRRYVEKYHGLDSAAYLFRSVIKYIDGELDRHSLVTLYHPLLSEYSSRQPMVEHPLVNNRIES